VPSSLAHALETLLASEPVDLAGLALSIARVDAPALDPAPVLAELDRIGRRATDHLATVNGASIHRRLIELNRVMFDFEGFHGNIAQYDDVRNSLLPQVIARRTGIPLTLAIVYMTVARAAGIEMFGVSFPGHFLVRVPQDAGDETSDPLILDPFDGGCALDRESLRALLLAHAGLDTPWDDALLRPCSSRQIVVRMLNNLKRLYVGMRSFPQAWMVTDAIVAIGGNEPEEIRDRGLLAYHLDDFPAALDDLERYVQITGTTSEETSQRSQIWEHVTTLRRRVASMN
jgi:regulator of sirC expression with transglutaminase-like and TPR domain